MSSPRKSTLPSPHLKASLARLQTSLDYVFKDASLLERALTHRSAVALRGGRRPARRADPRQSLASNERLEFIGDRVLGLIVAEWLLERFPDETEGALGPRHASLVSRNALAPVAEALDLSEMLNIAEHEERSGIRHLANVLADAMEAILGALYLDGGLDPVRRFVHRHWASIMKAQITPPKDPKTALQEFVLGNDRTLPVYETIRTEGPSHAPQFTVRVSALALSAEGTARSKRLAESAAAAALVRLLRRETALKKDMS